MRPFLAVLALLCLVSCTDDRACGPGTVAQDDLCVAVAPDAGAVCGAGTVASDAGVCVPATRPTDRRPCDGRFGPVPEGKAQTLYVDRAYAGADPDGTAARPYPSIQTAVDQAAAHTTVAVAAGTYSEAVALASPLLLEGRCAREVVVQGSVTVLAGDVTVRGLTIQGGAPGVAIRNTQSQVVLEYVRVQGSLGAGLRIEGSRVVFQDGEVLDTRAAGPSLGEGGDGLYVHSGANLTLASSFVEANAGWGIDLADATGTEAAPVHTSQSMALIDMNRVADNVAGGIRVHVFDERVSTVPATTGPEVAVRGNEIRDHGGPGVIVYDARFVAQDNVLATNATQAMTDDAVALAAAFSRVVIAGNQITDGPGSGLRIRSCLGSVVGNRVERHRGTGIEAQAGTLSVTSNLVQDNGAAGLLLASSIALVDMNHVVGNGCKSGDLPASGITLLGLGGAFVRDNVVTGSCHAGVHVSSGHGLTLSGNEVTGTQGVEGYGPDGSGHGIYVYQAPGTQVAANYVHDNDGAGITLDGVATTGMGSDVFLVDMNLVADNRFVGINVQASGAGQILSNAVAGNAGFGIRILDSVGTGRTAVTGNAAQGTLLSVLGDDGDGIALVHAAATITSNTRLDANARAGILVSHDAAGLVDMNQVGLVDMNRTYDIMVQASPSLVVGAGNTTGVADVIKDALAEAVNLKLTSLAERP